MLSNPRHHLTSRHAPAANMDTTLNGHLPEHHMQNTDLHSPNNRSQNALRQLQLHIDARRNSQANNGLAEKQNLHTYHDVVSRAKGSRQGSGKLECGRRRISRACDQCNQQRTKCNGQSPCAHCIELNLSCEYIRERKKRGKASRKELEQAAAKTTAHNGQKPWTKQALDRRSLPESHPGDEFSKAESSADGQENSGMHSRSMSMNDINGSSMLKEVGNTMKPSVQARSVGHIVTDLQPHFNQLLMATHQDDDLHGPVDSFTDMGLDSYEQMHSFRSMMNGHLMRNGKAINYDAPSSLSIYDDFSYSIQSPKNYPPPKRSSASFGLDEIPLPGFQMETPGLCPRWDSAPFPKMQYSTSPSYRTNSSSRYPVLRPLIPYLGNIITLSLACDLLELYFKSSTSAQMHPLSPYVLGYVFRKRSILHPTKPRVCSPALLASILWVAAQTSDATFLTMPPLARGRVCQQLLELTIRLLNPLIHSPPVCDSSPSFCHTTLNGAALGGLGVSMPGSVNIDTINSGDGSFGASGQLDDVVTYIHLATVVSASEYKGASLRWWNTVWSLARELKLSRELPPNQSPMYQREVDANGETDNDSDVPSTGLSEEEREERRRIWWLVYIIDRHLSLCYNKPLFLLDMECDGLLQPMDDTLWQIGEFYSRDASTNMVSPNGSMHVRSTGPMFECTSHSIFGFFLPLMTILGEIVDLKNARNHPRFGVGFRSTKEWDDHANEITLQLEAYERSLKEFELRHLNTINNNSNNQETIINSDVDMTTSGPLYPHQDLPSPSNHSVNTSTSRMTTESDVQTRIVLAYSTHVMHVLHILLTGKWDPISLLDDNDLWISSESFVNATSHAVSAAEAIESILEFDPGLEFMPFFFGVYLLQGSFLLLLIADKLQSEASLSVVKACETIVRAHEACVVTLNTEYQRNFRKVMRSALAQVRGRVLEDFGEQQLRRREMLSLYRWTKDGTGLAL